jgi:hypothetical protein
VAQHCDRSESEVLPKSVKVVDLRLDVDGLGSDPSGRLAAPPLIVIDEAKYGR